MSHKLTDGGHVLHVGTLARVEGEGAMHIEYPDGRVTDVQLRIYEPPRFYEAFLRGRAYTEPPDITARICGICPVAYQMSACWAIEDACGVTVPEEIRLMRRLLYCGEWIESHALHIFLLHAPDFLGYDGAIEMAADHPAVVERGLRMKKAGNDLMDLVGGRSIHPINVRIGGFYRMPTVAELRRIRPVLERAREEAVETVRLVAGFRLPRHRAAVRVPLAALRGRLPDRVGQRGHHGRHGVRRCRTSPGTSRSSTSSTPTRCTPPSTASRPYVGGPSRPVHAQLRPALAARPGDRPRGRAWDRRAATRSARSSCAPSSWSTPTTRRCGSSTAGRDGVTPSVAGTAAGRRGVRRERGAARRAVPPLRPRRRRDHHRRPDRPADLAEPAEHRGGPARRWCRRWSDLDDHALPHRCEHAIRNYDPCISCATHFLDLTVERS